MTVIKKDSAPCSVSLVGLLVSYSWN